MIGVLHTDSFKELKWLKFLNIFNDGRYYENQDVYHRNTLHVFDPKLISQFTELEEINLSHLGMWGYINADFVKNL